MYLQCAMCYIVLNNTCITQLISFDQTDRSLDSLHKCKLKQHKIFYFWYYSWTPLAELMKERKKE